MKIAEKWASDAGFRFVDDITKSNEFTIVKADQDKMLVFGWGNVAIRKDGEQIEDWQGDMIDPEELEKAAYDHVLNFRSTGESHNPALREKGRLVESCVFTVEKQEALGIPPGTVPIGWWIGYKIDDPTAWEKIKKGEYAMFSVEGKGERVPVQKSKDSIAKSFLECLAEIEKFNPHHAADGRFSTRDGMTMFRPGNFKSSIDRENARRGLEGNKQGVGGAFDMIGHKPYSQARAEQQAAEESSKNKQSQAEFKPAKNVKAAEEYARDTLGIPTVRYGKLHVDVANDVNKSLTEHFNQFPELKKNIQYVGSIQERGRLKAEQMQAKSRANAVERMKKDYPHLDDETVNREVDKSMTYLKEQGYFKTERIPKSLKNAYAVSYSGNYYEKEGLKGIAVNEKYGKKPADAIKLIQSDVNSQFHPVGTGSVKAIVDHELGHQVDDLLGTRGNPKIQKLYNDIGTSDQMGEKLSRYAHSSNNSNNNKYSEFVAEGWMEYRNNPNPRPTARAIGEEMEREYSTWKKD